MSYLPDPDLAFLEQISSQNLEPLVYCLTKDKNGSSRLTETLTSSPEYKKHYPEHNKYWKSIAAELQKFGADTIVTHILRDGKGIRYREILCDVCEKSNIKVSHSDAIFKIEQQFIFYITERILEKLNEDQLKEIAQEIGLNYEKNLDKQAMVSAFMYIFKKGGFKSYQILVTVVNGILKFLIGKGLPLAGNALLTKFASIITGPIGIVVTALWAIFDISGPAFRVTIPAVICVAILRQQYLLEKYGDDEDEKLKEFPAIPNIEDHLDIVLPTKTKVTNKLVRPLAKLFAKL